MYKSLQVFLIDLDKPAIVCAMCILSMYGQYLVLDCLAKLLHVLYSVQLLSEYPAQLVIQWTVRK